jgi:hypothetical protein
VQVVQVGEESRIYCLRARVPEEQKGLGSGSDPTVKSWDGTSSRMNRRQGRINISIVGGTP